MWSGALEGALLLLAALKMLSREPMTTDKLTSDILSTLVCRQCCITRRSAAGGVRGPCGSLWELHSLQAVSPGIQLGQEALQECPAMLVLQAGLWGGERG